MRHAVSASALLAVAAARHLFIVILAREGGGKSFEGDVRMDAGIGREDVRVSVYVYVRRCAESTLVATAVHLYSPFSNRQFALLQLPHPKLEVLRELSSHVYQ